MQAQAKVTGFSAALRGAAVQQRAGARRATPAVQPVQAATITTRKLKASAAKPAPPPPRKAATVAGSGTKKIKAGPATTTKKAVGGTKIVGGTRAVGGTTSKKITAIEVFSKDKVFRTKQPDGAKPAPKVLARIEQLRLLSKLEQSGLLSQLEKSGVTLSKLEQSGLLSTAEKFGLLGLVADRSVPSTLYALAALLLAAGPAAVYFTPDDSGALVALQAVIALTCVLGGSAAWGGASLLSTLQKS
ncbi:hypothetical protein ABPG77_004533 [Micractinium sp. CCAP 211/92]